jgi:chorismate-pyruvate lyase
VNFLPVDAPDLAELIGLFHQASDDLGAFAAAAKLSAPFAELLDHGNHMTVTVERFHDCPVDVQVLRERLSDDYYAREILLRRTRDGRVVQHGIVQIDRRSLPPDVWREIEARGEPLGRILIRHQVHREVELCGLWQVAAGPKLSEWFDCPASTITYGRTALIHFDRQPALKLLEIIAPT